MNAGRVGDALRILSEQAAEREHQLSAYPSTSREERDNDVDAPSPIFYSFYNSGGNDAILKMTNFAPFEFQKLYSIIQPQIVTT